MTQNQQKNLAKQRETVLCLEPEKALDAILDAKHPEALVHSFPEDDFYFLIKDIGREDSITLLSLASYKQWEYILDLEVWERDRIDNNSVTIWLDLLLSAAPDRFLKWFFDEQTEFIEFYLFKNIEVIIRNHDQDPSDLGPDLTTYDNVFYFRILDEPKGFETPFMQDENSYDNETTSLKDRRRLFLTKLLKHLAYYDHIKYQKVLFEASAIIPAESEEEAYRLRNVRLAEKGFMPFYEAVGIYKPLPIKYFNKKNIKIIPKNNSLSIPVPFYPAKTLDRDNLFTGSLKTIESDELMRQIQAEFAALANQVISADQRVIKNRKDLQNIVRKACGYVNIGLEHLTGGDIRNSVNLSAALIKKYPLINIFRLGYGFALKLQWKVKKWYSKSWFANMGLPLTFWDEKWFGVLGGLMLKKPLFFDDYKTGKPYREFESIDDIKKTRKTLKTIINLDNLLSHINPKIDISHNFLTYKNIILTNWAKDYLGISKKTSSLLLDDFKLFIKELWQDTGHVNKGPRKIRDSMKEAFLNWISEKSGTEIYAITEKLGQTFEDLFTEIESEYGKVEERYLDPKHIQLFIIS